MAAKVQIIFTVHISLRYLFYSVLCRFGMFEIFRFCQLFIKELQPPCYDPNEKSKTWLMMMFLKHQSKSEQLRVNRCIVNKSTWLTVIILARREKRHMG